MLFAATWKDLESVILRKVSHCVNFWISLSISKLLGIILIDLIYIHVENIVMDTILHIVNTKGHIFLHLNSYSKIFSVMFTISIQAVMNMFC